MLVAYLKLPNMGNKEFVLNDWNSNPNLNLHLCACMVIWVHFKVYDSIQEEPIAASLIQ